MATEIVKYKIKKKVNHFIVDGNDLGPEEIFEQTTEFYDTHKAFVDPLTPMDMAKIIKSKEPVEVDDEDGGGLTKATTVVEGNGQRVVKKPLKKTKEE